MTTTTGGDEVTDIAVPGAPRRQDEVYGEHGLGALLENLEKVSAGTGEERSDTRERILGAAIELFAINGFQGTSTRQIAQAVGIKAPGLYAHFASKEAILGAAMARAMGTFLRAVAEPAGEEQPRQRLKGLVQRHVLFQITHYALASANDLLLKNSSTLELVAADVRELLVTAQRGYVRSVRNAVEALSPNQTHAQIVVHTFAIVTLCDGVSSWYKAEGPLTPEQVQRDYWELCERILDGASH